MRSLSEQKKGSVDIIVMAVVAAVVIAVSLVIVFSIMGGLDTSGIDENIRANVYGEGGTTWKNGTTFAGNASNSLISNLETFYTISPIYIVVLAAVGIIGAIMMIMVRRK